MRKEVLSTKGYKRSAALITALALTIFAAGCGSSSGDESGARLSYSSASQGKGYAVTETAAMNADDYYYSDEAVEEYNYGAGVMNSAGGTDYSVSEEETNTLPDISNEKLVYRCHMNFETTDYDNSVISIRSLIDSYGGILEAEEVYTTGGYGSSPTLYTYSATVRIPSASFQTFLDNSGSIGELKSKTQNVTNLTQEYNDLGAELEVLEAKRDSYIEMMKEATSLDDMESLLMIDSRLTEVEISINQIKTRMNTINNDAAYSYIYLNVSEVREYEAPVAETFGEKLSQAFHNGWISFTEGCQDFVIWCAENVIGIIIFLVIVLILWITIFRRLFRKFRVWRKSRKTINAYQGQAVAAGNALEGAPAEVVTSDENAANNE